MNTNWLKNLPAGKRNLLGGILVVAVAALIGFLLVMPKVQRIAALKTQVADLGSETAILKAKAQRIDKLIQENRRLQETLDAQKRQLPEEEEAVTLLKQVTDIGVQAGLVFRLWRPSAPVLNASGLYQELPVEVEVSGGYHELGDFLEYIARLDRIVNITNLYMVPDKERGLVAHFTAIAFAAPKPGQTTGAAPDGKKKEKQS